MEKHINIIESINRIRRPNLSTTRIATPVPITWHNATKNADILEIEQPNNITTNIHYPAYEIRLGYIPGSIDDPALMKIVSA